MRTSRLIFSILLAVIAAQPSDAQTRQPVVAGTFYPADSLELATMIHTHLANVPESSLPDGDLLALIVPHAGLVYSGQIAAHAFKLLEHVPTNNVILCGPSHRYRLSGASVYGPGIIWHTPLGDVPCNDSLCARFERADRVIRVVPGAHSQEHCLEVQLPYIQTTLDSPRIVPIVVGTVDPRESGRLADALASAVRQENAILVASTDWQHYRPVALGWPMDSLGIDCVEHLDPDRLNQNLSTGRVEACGGPAAVAVLKAALELGADTAVILKYGNSGDVSGDTSSVVGYLAAAIYRTKAASEIGEDSAITEEYVLRDSERKTLLKIARESIAAHLSGQPAPDWDVPAILKEPGAAFVTLKHDDALRGCIGHTVAVMPLFETVADCAVQAATSDPRFYPVRARELDSIQIEISVLTPLQKVTDLNQIKVGRDGLMITLGRDRGLLLPQVATEYGWDRDEFLRYTCRKASLPADAYKSPEAILEKFQAIIFSEENH